MSPHEKLAVGLDLGTGGARAVALDLQGNLIGHARTPLPAKATTVRGACVEQDPVAWRSAAETALHQLTSALLPSARIAGVAVDATSGTFLVMDGGGRPLTPGIMYNDLRAADHAREAAAALSETLGPYGIQIAPSFALAKLVYLARTNPALFEPPCRVVHQTDWIVGSLCGEYDVSDVSTALKTGVDPHSLEWPQSIETDLGIPLDCLPRVVLPGTPIGRVTPAAAGRTGLPSGTPVVAGCTDGTAGSLASGARDHGDLNVTLGSTLVFKAVSDTPLVDASGAVYNHRHPGGGFLPGAASSTGAEWTGSQLGNVDLDALSQRAGAELPTGRIVYPLCKRGERFPFAHSGATGFGLREIADPVVRFAAGMEGVAMLERLGIERLRQLGLTMGPTVFSTGGAAENDVWLRIRAAVTRRVYQSPRWSECAVGAALLAAMPITGSFATAARTMVGFGRTVEPDGKLAERYDEQYASFVESLRQHGYLSESSASESNGP